MIAKFPGGPVGMRQVFDLANSIVSANSLTAQEILDIAIRAAWLGRHHHGQGDMEDPDYHPSFYDGHLAF